MNPLLIRETGYTDDIAHAADQRVHNMPQGCRQQVPPCVPHEVGLAVLQAIVQHAPRCLRVQRTLFRVVLRTCASLPPMCVNLPKLA